MSYPIIFIGGPNRSGTSWLRAMLGSHSQIAIPPTESHFFDQIKNNFLKENNSNLNSFLQWKENHKKVSNWGVTSSLIVETLKNENTNQYKQLPYEYFFDILLRCYTDQIGKSIPGEKSTYLEFHFERLYSFYGRQLKFIQVIRDPLDTYNSFNYYQGILRYKNPISWSNKWSSSVLLGHYYSNRYKDNFIQIKYEDLLLNTDKVLEKICAFIGVKLESERMKQMFDFSQKNNTSFNSKKPEIDTTIKKIIQKNVKLEATIVGYNYGDFLYDILYKYNMQKFKDMLTYYCNTKQGRHALFSDLQNIFSKFYKRLYGKTWL